MTATATVTDLQIRNLETNAAQAGDHGMALICQIALEEVVLDEDTTIDSLLIASFIELPLRRRISERYGTADDARAECARVIADAAAQD
jgi:hypothetical protein